MIRGHVEIAGAGFAGLSLAVMLAERGWSVRVHERAPEVREIGAGIFMHHNGLLVLEETGLMDLMRSKGVQLARERILDERGRTLQDRRLTGTARVWSFPRQELIEALLGAALHRGVEVLTNSGVMAAQSTGSLKGANGELFHADLVIGADGHRSVVRQSLSLTTVQKQVSTTSIRFLLAGRELAEDPITTEHWSSKRRVALAACGPSHTYIYMAAPASDFTGSAVPIDAGSWSEHFPRLTSVFERLLREEPFKASYSLVRCRAWSDGSVALLGDAAHALPPTLGQGTNLTLANARSLVTFLEESDDVPTALSKWERAVRSVTDDTQRWAGYYNWATTRWPRGLGPMRAGAIWAFGAVPALNRRLRIADRTPPVVRQRAVHAGPAAAAVGR